MAPIRWQQDRSIKTAAWPVPDMVTAIRRGLMCRCPGCGTTHLFQGYLRVRTECSHCGAPLGMARADDAPPYFTILIVGHIVVPLMFWMQRAQDSPDWLLAAIFLPLTVVLSLALLRPVKGGTVGLMLRLGMLKQDTDA